MDATYALDPFDDDGRDLVALGAEAVFQGLLVVEGQEDDVFGPVDGRDDVGVICGSYGEGCPSVEGFPEGHDLAASGMEACQFECVLIGFRP